MKKRVSLLLAVVIVLACVVYGVGQKRENVMKLYLKGNMEAMYNKKDVRDIEASFILNGKKVKSYATVKVQGTSSLDYEKKNYTIKFYKDPDHEVKYDVDVGWGDQNEYCFKANWIDKTHSRNIVTARLVAQTQEKYGLLEQAPCHGLIDGFPVEVYINNEFHGLYTWNIPKSEWLFNMDEDNADHIVLCGENWGDGALFRAAPDFETWDVEVGPKTEETLAKFTRLTDFIMYSSDEEFKEHFGEYMDLDAMLNYFVWVEFAYLRDNRGKNMLMVTYDGDLWYPSLYDLDTSWGTHWRGEKLYEYQEELVSFAERSYLAERVQTLFAQELHDRYFELRGDIMTKEHILAEFNKFDAGISAASKKREIKRWGEEIPGYDVSQIEEYLDSVTGRLDEKYRGLVN